MKKILIAVDDSLGSKKCIEACVSCFSGKSPESVILMHVRQFGGKTLMHDRISDTDISELQDELQGTDVEEDLERKSDEILKSHQKSLEENGINGVKTISKSGHVAEEIVNTAKEEGAEMIIIGCTRGMIAKLVMGDVTKDVSRMAEIPVLLAK